MSELYFRFCALKAMVQRNHTHVITVWGSSMFPVIREGAKITIETNKEYKIGDVIVFYNDVDDSILIHRVLRKHQDYYICKGDNSFRLERVSFSRVIGKALALPTVDNRFVVDSYEVGQEFIRNNCNVEVTIQSLTYQKYKNKYLIEGITK